MQRWCLCRVTGRGYMDVNRISGYIPGKMVFFLMQARAPVPALHLYSRDGMTHCRSCSQGTAQASRQAYLAVSMPWWC